MLAFRSTIILFHSIWITIESIEKQNKCSSSNCEIVLHCNKGKVFALNPLRFKWEAERWKKAIVKEEISNLCIELIMCAALFVHLYVYFLFYFPFSFRCCCGCCFFVGSVLFLLSFSKIFRSLDVIILTLVGLLF